MNRPQALHEHPYGVMHRDLHLGNVLFLGDDFLLGDFGTAKTTVDLKAGD